jgi:hypothetical protein
MALDDLLLAVTVDNCIQTLKCTTTHKITHTLLLYAKPLDLIVDVKEERVVPWRVVTGANKKAARTRC